MICKINSAMIYGVEACIVAIETDVGEGLPTFDMVGLLSSEVREARERVRTALKNTGYLIPSKRITINLAPADIRKTGTYFDMPIAISILIGIGMIKEQAVEGCLFAGELGLDGQVVKGNGLLPIVLQAKKKGIKKCFIPQDSIYECQIADDIDIVGVDSLKQLVHGLITGEFEDKGICNKFVKLQDDDAYDFRDLKGQLVARRAAEITAAGMHNMLMIGSPGAGKSMLAKCMSSILPDMSLTEKKEVAIIHSVAGMLQEGQDIKRPFRSPHHSSTINAMTGGGRNPKPGELTLAHRGILFLDELPEFSRQTIEVLRQPLEERYISISRVEGKYRFPADFIFLAASNPCKCGYYPDRNKCKCTEKDIKKYMDKISGPIMDRIDLCIQVEAVKYDELSKNQKAESSSEIKKRVESARIIQTERYEKMDINFNSQLGDRYVEEYCPLGKKEKEIMEQAFYKFSLSARSYYKIIKVARTISDLEGAKNITVKHLCEAMAYRI